MNVFQQCWVNWVKRPVFQLDASGQVWLNELNQAIFSALEKNLPDHIRMSVVKTPAFSYNTVEDGVNISRTACVTTTNFTLPRGGTFEEQVDAACAFLVKAINLRNVRTVFFYTPVLPCGRELVDGSDNRHMMTVRMHISDSVIEQ